MTRALLESPVGSRDSRQCNVVGPPFGGLNEWLAGDRAEARAEQQTLRVLVVHGIGSPSPGYSTRVSENLAKAMGLTVRSARLPSFTLADPRHFGDEALGSMRVTRFSDKGDTRQMFVHEVTWAPIIARQKALLDFDTAGEHVFRRTTINNAVKAFSNERLPDLLLYVGDRQSRVQAAVSQAICWQMSHDWSNLPEGGIQYCDPNAPAFLSKIGHRHAIITHSLGSRILMESLETMAQQIDRPFVASALTPLQAERLARWRELELPVYLLSNQLALLQLGRPVPDTAGQFAAFYSNRAPFASRRLFRRTNFVTFNDPNDILSYSVPPGFVDRFLDASICPTVVNVTLNVAKPSNILGLGDFANPLEAHAEYENDERVIALIANGIGTPTQSAVVRDRCEWLETRRRPVNGTARARRRRSPSRFSPVNHVVLPTTPASTGNEHLQALAAISRRLRNAKVTRVLRTATEPTEIFRLLSEQP